MFNNKSVTFRISFLFESWNMHNRITSKASFLSVSLTKVIRLIQVNGCLYESMDPAFRKDFWFTKGNTEV